jgi:endonuclease YncB( thermonuclease family)
MKRTGKLSIALLVAVAIGFIAGRWTDDVKRPALAQDVTAQTDQALPTDNAAQQPTWRAKVTRVIDGRTVEVRFRPPEPVHMLVRLLQVDAPYEHQRDYKPPRAALAQMVYGKQVELRFEEPGELDQDRTCRILAYLVADGKNANLEMVRQGAAKYLTRYGQGRYPEAFGQAQTEARQANRGVWAER